MHCGRQDQSDGAEYLGESDQSDTGLAVSPAPSLGRTQRVCLWHKLFQHPLPVKTAAKTIATIHSAKFMMSS